MPVFPRTHLQILVALCTLLCFGLLHQLVPQRLCSQKDATTFGVEHIHNQDDGLVAFAVTLNSCRAIGNWFALRLVRETDQHASLGESEYEVYLGFIGFFLGAEPCCCRVFEGASGAGGFQGAFKKS